MSVHVHTHILDDGRMIQALEQLYFPHDILSIRFVHTLQTDTLYGDRLTSRIIQRLEYRSELSSADTLA